MKEDVEIKQSKNGCWIEFITYISDTKWNKYIIDVNTIYRITASCYYDGYEDEQIYKLSIYFKKDNSSEFTWNCLTNERLNEIYNQISNLLNITNVANVNHE